MARALIGCSGWNYADWRGRFYPDGLPQRRWLEHYASRFDVVEVNATFYRLPSPAGVARWVEQTSPAFTFVVKGSRYLTHMKRLRDTGQGVARFYERLEPLMAAGRLGPVLWQLPPDFRRDDERLATFLDALPPDRHAFEARHPSWYADDVAALCAERDVAFVVADDARRPLPPTPRTASWSFVRLHFGARGRRGNYSAAELDAWAARIAVLREHGDAYVFCNNDWEAFAPRNAAHLRRALEA